jgi:hypothetical protein
MPGTTDPLVTCYALEAHIYRSLLTIAREQGALLEAGGEDERCVALTARRRVLLRSLTALERDMEPLKRRWCTEGAGREQRARLETLLDAIAATLDALVAQEERNARLWRLRRARLPQEVSA